MKITEYLRNNRIYLDGGMGTLLQVAGLNSGELPERWNITHPDVIVDIHRAYFDAGSNIVNTNTFGANSLKFSDVELRDIIFAAVKNARRAAEESRSEAPKWVALDVGPLGRMLKPYGDLDFEDAVGIFAKTVKIGAMAGADLIFIETMNDSYETKAELLAAKECCELPVFVSNAYGEDGKLMTGATPAAMIAMLEGMGADAIGVNCSLGPKALLEVIRSYSELSSLPLLFKPNAGLPRAVSGKTVYDVDAVGFSQQMSEAAKMNGVRALGGCCGTTPEYIAELVRATRDISLSPIEEKSVTAVSSYASAVAFDKEPVLIGERINPTGKPRFKEALRLGDMDYILREGIAEEECGAQILDVNVGLPEIDEEKMLVRAITELQAVTALPLQIDTANPRAMAAALRRYNGKAMINSVNGKAESMAEIFPLVKKYGGVVVALTLDEGGIPKTAEGRLAIAERILAEAEKWGICKKDIIFDPLAMAVSADKDAAKETLRCVKLINEKLGCKTSLGVSNVSFGLPARELINSSFFTAAMFSGLSAAIINPHSVEMMKAWRAYLALSGLDENFTDYISYAEGLSVEAPKAAKTDDTGSLALTDAIIKGRCEAAHDITQQMLGTYKPLSIVNEHIIPALNTVGVGFEKKSVYLPQLLMSAEAAKSAFEVIKSVMTDSGDKRKTKIVLATVKGDIHDIGKNIVKLLLENYGFTVLDLGHDVSPEEIKRAACEIRAGLVGLSALMTTTVPAMEETIKLLRAELPSAKIMVGGAVLNEDYAKMIGADFYGCDAMEAVRYAERLESSVG